MEGIYSWSNIIKLLTLCASMLCAILFFGCDIEQEQHINFIMPDGLCGVIKIFYEQGSDRTTTTNNMAVEIPENGVAILPGDNIFSKPSLVTATYSSGVTIPVANLVETGTISTGTVALHIWGNRVDEKGPHTVMFIGTSQEAEYHRKVEGF